MALFGLGDKRQGESGPPSSHTRPLAGHESFCRICNQRRQFSRCWLRVDRLTQCLNCQAVFENPAAVYRQDLPVCPRCGEYLEQPGFEYGLCDGCGSKFELTAGTLPGLLPNAKQRAEMEKSGKVWRRE